MTLISKECFERGCACYDSRVDIDAVRVIQQTWIGLTLADKEEYLAQDLGGNRLDAMDWASKRLKEKNT